MGKTTDIFQKISAGLLMLTGILHIIAPIVLGSSMETMGMVLFGVIYFALGVLLLIKGDKNWVLLFSIICPFIGMIAGTTILLTSFSFYLLFMVILDPIIVILMILVYKEYKK